MRPPSFLRLCGAVSLVGAVLFVTTPTGRAMVDDALSFAYEAADPYVKEGFTIREDAWGGDLEEGGQKGIRHQLFKGNEYWFWAATDVEGAELEIHIYDASGQLAEAEFWKKGKFAAARISPSATGSYFLLVKVVKSPADRTGWAMVYGFR